MNQMKYWNLKNLLVEKKVRAKILISDHFSIT